MGPHTRSTRCLCAFVALWSLPACGESDTSRTGPVGDVPGLSPRDQGAPPAPTPSSIQAAGSGASNSQPPTSPTGVAGAGGSDPEPAPAEPEPVEPEPAPAEPVPQDEPPPQMMDEEPPPAQGIFGGLFGPMVDAETFCATYEQYCGFGGDQRHADLATCLQFYDDNPEQQACFNMHLNSAIDGTAAACNGEPSAFCFNIHCPHATGIDYCM